MPDWDISTAAAAGGFSKEAHCNHLVVFIDPVKEETTKFNGEGTQIVARVAFACCETCMTAQPDEVVYGEALAPSILDRGPVVAGRLTRGIARAQRAAPWLLEPELTSVDHDAVQKFMDTCAVKMPSGKIVIEVPSQDSEVY